MPPTTWLPPLAMPQISAMADTMTGTATMISLPIAHRYHEGPLIRTRQFHASPVFIYFSALLLIFTGHMTRSPRFDIVVLKCMVCYTVPQRDKALCRSADLDDRGNTASQNTADTQIKLYCRFTRLPTLLPCTEEMSSAIVL